MFAHAVLCAEPSTLKGRRFGNVILVAADQPLPADALAQRAGLGPFPYRVLTGARLDQLRLGAHPFTDADAEPSPTPTDPDGLPGLTCGLSGAAGRAFPITAVETAGRTGPAERAFPITAVETAIRRGAAGGRFPSQPCETH